MFFVLTFQYHYTHPGGFVKGADDQSLPLRGRWQREALAEGEASRGFFSPPVGCADSPLTEGALQRGSAVIPSQ